MKMKSSKKGFLYDIVGSIIFILIVFSCLMCCSPTTRKQVNQILDSFRREDTILIDTIDVSKDSIPEIITKIKTDTIYIKETDNTVRDTIPLFKGNDNLYYLTAVVNGIPMKFALDTGCSDIYISIVEYLFFERQGLIKDKNINPSVSIIANGDTIQNYGTITLETITIGNKTIKNVSCSVSNNQDSRLLLGQGVLSKMGDITIKYNQNILIIE